MGLQQNVWHADAVAQGGFLRGMTRILLKGPGSRLLVSPFP